MYLISCFRFPLVSSRLLTGQLPALSTLFSEFLFRPLAFCTGNQMDYCLCAVFARALWTSYNFLSMKVRSNISMAVISVVTFELKFRFTASLLSTLGKKSLVIAPFVVSSHWLCHFLISFRESIFITLFDILLYVTW